MAEAVGQLLSDVLPDGTAAAREIGSLPAARWPLVVGLSLAVHLAGWALATQAWEKVRHAAINDRPAPTVLIQVVQAPPRPETPPAPPPPKAAPEPKPQPRPQARPEPPPPPPPAQKPPPRTTPIKHRTKAHPKPAPMPVRRAAPSRPKPRAAPPNPSPPPVTATTPAQPVVQSPAPPAPSRPAAPPRQEILASYLARLQAAIRSHRFYPARSRRRGEEGKVLLSLRIGRDGTLQGLALSTSSGHRRLDRAALQTLERLGKAPPLPKDLPDETLEVEVPIRFQLRD